MSELVLDREICEEGHGQDQGMLPMMEEKDGATKEDAEVLRSLETKLYQRNTYKLQPMTLAFSIRCHALLRMLDCPEICDDTIKAMIKEVRTGKSHWEVQRLEHKTSNDAFGHITKSIRLQILATSGRITGFDNVIPHYLSKLDDGFSVLFRGLLYWEVSRLEFHLAYLLLCQNESLTDFTLVSGLVIHCYNAGIYSPLTQTIEEHLIDRRKHGRTMHLTAGGWVQEESYRSGELLSTVYPNAVIDFTLTSEKQMYVLLCL